MESTSPDGPVAKYIEKKGDGIQHVAFRVENIEDALDELRKKGIRLIDEKPRIGAGGAKIAGYNFHRAHSHRLSQTLTDQSCLGNNNGLMMRVLFAQLYIEFGIEYHYFQRRLGDEITSLSI